MPFPPRTLMKKERLIPLIVATALFMENMDSTVIATSLPAIAADIGTSPLTLKLAITSYLLSLARSEERRVGKEGGSGESLDHSKKTFEQLRRRRMCCSHVG